MNDHVLYLSAAYALAAVCLVWECLALRWRRRNAMRHLREVQEDDR